MVTPRHESPTWSSFLNLQRHMEVVCEPRTLSVLFHFSLLLPLSNLIYFFQKQVSRASGFGLGTSYQRFRAFLMAQMAKTVPAMQETGVWSLGWEDPLEKGMATHSRILAWRIPWTEAPGRLQSMGLQRVRHDWRTNACTYFPRINLLR